MSGTTAHDQEIVRRLDWRFLFPEPRLGRVVVIGVPDEGLVEAVQRFAPGLEHRLAAGDGNACTEVAAGAARFDLAVLGRPGARELRTAAKLLRPGGGLYAEVSGRSRSVLRGPLRRRARDPGQPAAPAPVARSPRRLLALVERHGFEHAAAHWHWPDFARCRSIVPLSDAGALRLALERIGGGGGGARALAARLGRLAAAAGQLERLVPCFSVVAYRRESPS